MGLFDLFKQIKTEISNAVKEEMLIENKPDEQSKQILQEHEKIAYKKQVAISHDGELPNLKDILPSLTESKGGLYPHEVLMLDYAHLYKTNSENSFQSFWKWRYYVLDPQEILGKLYQEGFITIGDLKSTLQKKTMTEIKEELSNIGQKTSGKKSDLIELLLSVGDIDYLDEKFNDRLYVLTEKGKAELDSKENEYIMYLHRKQKYMSVYEMNYFLHNENPSHLRYRDIIWRELNKASGEHFQAFDFGAYRCTRRDMYEFSMEEGSYKNALHFLCEVISFDLSGLGNKTNPISLDDMDFIRQVDMESRFVNIKISLDNGHPVRFSRELQNLKDSLEMAGDQFIDIVREYMAEIRIHERVFTHEECANFALASIGLEEQKIDDVLAVAEERLKKLFNL